MNDVIILIAGSSNRMGREKALLPFSNKESFVCHLLETYFNLPFNKIYCVVNKQNVEALKQECKKYTNRLVFIENLNPEKGRFRSILLGINKVKSGNGVFIQNIDNPFINSELLSSMLNNYRKDSFLVPQFKGKNGHPLLLGSELVQELKDDPNNINDLKSFLNSHKKHSYITHNQSILANINSRKEYQKWFPDMEL